MGDEFDKVLEDAMKEQQNGTDWKSFDMPQKKFGGKHYTHGKKTLEYMRLAGLPKEVKYSDEIKI